MDICHHTTGTGWNGCTCREVDATIAALRAENASLREALERVLVVGSAATGFLMCENFSDMHEYVEKVMGRPVWTHEMGDEEVAKAIREAAKPDFLAALKEAFAALAGGHDA